jgi:hypothetical protein
MDVLMIGTVAGGLGMMVVFLAGYLLLRNRIAPIDSPPDSHNTKTE